MFNIFFSLINLFLFFLKFQLPGSVKLSSPSERQISDAAQRKKKGKCKEGEIIPDENENKKDLPLENRLATLDIFAGCGGLSEGLQQAGNFNFLHRC